ncbi:isopentenyl phosphate kinase family protein [Halorubellus sp. JP-L1]|uniref:isopentenyl phosphate kinase n=1 Tax=Halorubellus sp. JP-L1 TaxID=2715753 RepID=UPI00140D54BA|nr:isopentenyl phosphate kinase [Halorubellus sp. JP-L1]NHN40781.1 isopentenyl phosphate kinase family protein [Halorubellus sp. JP-L1]
MIVLKLGGSVVTEKDRDETVDGASLERAAAAIGASLADGGADDDLVVVHGGGSFGHPHAEEWGASTTAGVDDVRAVNAIHGAMTTLNEFVLRALQDADVPAVPVHPLSAGSRDADGELSLPSEQVRTLVDEGFVPVLHGDLVAHAGAGATVLSGDEIVTSLAASLDADRVGVCSTVPGVLDADDAVVPEIRSFEDVAAVLGGSEATDVSGGMAGKVRALLELGSPASIFELDALEAFLDGDRPGTTVDGA